MEMDMSPTPMAYRTRSSKRARSPSSPTQYDRPAVSTPLLTPLMLRNMAHEPFCLTVSLFVLQKRFSSAHDTSMPVPLPPFHPTAMRLRGLSEDWVSQTQDLRLESPSLEQSRFSTPVETPGEAHIDEVVMVDEPMVRAHSSSACSCALLHPLHFSTRSV